MCDHQGGSCDQQGGSCDPHDKLTGGDRLKIQTLTKSLFPYVTKLSPNEISSIKDKLHQKQHSPLQQVGGADQTCASNVRDELHKHSLLQVGEADQTCSSTQLSGDLDHQTKVDYHDDTVKRRPSLSLKKRRKKQQNNTTDLQKQASPFKERKFSPVKKLNLSTLKNQQELMTTSSQYPQKCDIDAVSSTIDEPPTSRYYPLQFVAATMECFTSPHHHGDDNSDALLNMGYLSPMAHTHNDSDCDPDKSSLLQSTLKCCSPVPSIPDSPLNTSFSLALPGSSCSSSSTPEHSSSSHTDSSSPSPSPPSPTSFGNVLNEKLVFQQVQCDGIITGSHDQHQDPFLIGSCDQVVDMPPDGSDNYEISYVSDEPPKSKLTCSDIPMDADDNTCIITPELAPPTSSHLLDTLEQYGIPHVVYEQPFCSRPQDVPPVK